MYAMWLLILAVSSHAFHTAKQVLWNITTNPLIYGRELILKCIVFHNACMHNNTRQWSKGKQGNTLLCINGESINYEKYRMVTYKNTTDFDLIINDVKNTDINESYMCSCGFYGYEAVLQLDNVDFIYPPMKANIIDLSCQDHDNIAINFTVKAVYPLPYCSMALSDTLIVDAVDFFHKTIEGSVMYLISYSANYNSTIPIHDAFLNISCSVGEINVYDISRKLHPCGLLEGNNGGKGHYGVLIYVIPITAVYILIQTGELLRRNFSCKLSGNTIRYEKRKRTALNCTNEYMTKPNSYRAVYDGNDMSLI